MDRELFDMLIQAGWRYAPEDCLIDKTESTWVSWGERDKEYVLMSLTGYKILKFSKDIKKDFGIITGAIPHTKKQRRKSTRKVTKP